MSKYELGDQYILEGRVGGGGIHKLILKEVTIVMTAVGGEAYQRIEMEVESEEEEVDEGNQS